MSKFKVGDKVMLKKSSSRNNGIVSNPTDVVGELIGTKSGWVGVRWGNSYTNFYDPFEDDLELVEEFTKPSGKIKSDGGSSSYYDLTISDKFLETLNNRKKCDGESFIKTEELIDELFDNNFDFGTLFKSLVRAHLQTKGAGKAGNNLGYEINKVLYYANKIKEKGCEKE